MSHYPRLVLIAASITALVPHTVHAQKDMASCKPVLDAVTKLYTTSYHAYSTMPATLPGGKPRQLEIIAIGNENYVLVDGAWKRSPVDRAAMAKQDQENINDAKVLSCHRLREESAGGVRAVVYAEHSESDAVKSDGQVWVAVVTGLVLRTESDESMPGDSSTNHNAIRYEYTNVQPPAGAK